MHHRERTGEGQVIHTGMDAQAKHVPFFRNYGPDITGLFTHDAGALGIKTGVTLALEEQRKEPEEKIGSILLMDPDDRLRMFTARGLPEDIIEGRRCASVRASRGTSPRREDLSS